MTSAQRENKPLVILAAAGFFLLLGGGICAALIGWRQVPGLAGEWLGMMVGIFSTPFLLEAGALLGGATLLIIWNSWRRHCEGDECVFLEMNDPTEVRSMETDQPDRSTLRAADHAGVFPRQLDQVEEAMQTGGFQAAAGNMATCDEAKRQSPAGNASPPNCTHEHT